MPSLTAEGPIITVDGNLQVDGATEDAAAASTSGRAVAQRVSALEWRTEQVEIPLHLCRVLPMVVIWG